MADQKYQIFLSSTYEDLREERLQAAQAIQQLNHIPSGMEWFPASGIEQFEFIKPLIDECDYYVLILGGRYGSISKKTSKSYTDMEYEYALAQGKHILVFPHRAPESLPGNRLEKSDAGRQAFAAFRTKVMADTMAGFWSQPTELRAEITTALTNAFRTHPRVGWIRADASQENSARRNREFKLALGLCGHLGHAYLPLRTDQRRRWLLDDIEELKGFQIHQVGDRQAVGRLKITEGGFHLRTINAIDGPGIKSPDDQRDLHLLNDIDKFVLSETLGLCRCGFSTGGSRFVVRNGRCAV